MNRLSIILVSSTFFFIGCSESKHQYTITTVDDKTLEEMNKRDSIKRANESKEEISRKIKMQTEKEALLKAVDSAKRAEELRRYNSSRNNYYNDPYEDGYEEGYEEGYETAKREFEK